MENIVLIKPEQRITSTTQSPGMMRQAAVTPELCGNNGLWVGFVSAPPGSSGAHHHGDAESAIYIVRGRVRMYFGDSLETSVDAEQGDFIYVAPNTVHVEENLSSTEPVEFIVARNATSSLVVNVGG